MFKCYSPFISRKLNPDSYDECTKKICQKIINILDEKTGIRIYLFIIKSQFQNYRTLAKQNRDEGRQQLVIKTRKFIPVPFDIDSIIIKSITKNLSHGFRNYKLKIEFCDSFSNRAGETLVFDPILSLQLYDWWHPQYKEFLCNKF